MPHILPIEDSTDVSNLVVSELRALAFDVTTAPDGRAGWLLLEESEPDLSIVDVMLPDVNGFEILRRLREKGFDKPILLLTACGEEADRVVGLELGTDD
jgi:DNA-binding response OmpR family regulator